MPWLPSDTQVDDLDEAIDLINANEHGNGTAIFTRRCVLSSQTVLVHCCCLVQLQAACQPGQASLQPNVPWVCLLLQRHDAALA